MKAPLTFALTMGDPAGIGAEITIKSWMHLSRDPNYKGCFFLLDSPKRLEKIARMMNYKITIQPIQSPNDASGVFKNALPVLPIISDDFEAVTLGKPSPDNGEFILKSIDMACQYAMRGDVHGIITNPIHKASLKVAGFQFAGHTDYLQHICKGKDRAVMLLANDYLKAVPITVHQSLLSVCQQLTCDDIIETARICHQDFKKYFTNKPPVIYVTGLNPHASEQGHMGSEEQDIIIPAIRQLQLKNIHVKGPFAADSMFHEDSRKNYDLALCMYHDQALIPVKTLDFRNGVNVTLGLPIIRTSPDHGTAHDISDKFIADGASLTAAIKMAYQMAKHKNV